MSLKVTMFFENGDEGWSEVYYTNDNIISDFTGVQPRDFVTGTKAAKLITARLDLMTAENTLKHVRVSDLFTPGLLTVYDPDDAVAHGTYVREGALVTASAEIFASLLITLEAGLASRRKLYLGGIPEDNVRPPQAYRPQDVFRTNLDKFLKIVAAAPYVMVKRPAKPVAFGNRITAIDVVGLGKQAIVTPRIRPVGDPQSWYVLIRGVKSPPGWNGVHLARSIDNPANSMVIGPTRRVMRSLPTFVEGDPGTVQVFTPTYEVLTGWSIVRIVSRRRGRPFGGSRGRR